MLSFSFKKWLLIVLALVCVAMPVAGAEKEEGGLSAEKLRAWMGIKVDVDYRACDPAGCVPVKKAMLREVTEEAITVIVNGSPFYIPKHMIEVVTLSE